MPRSSPDIPTDMESITSSPPPTRRVRHVSSDKENASPHLSHPKRRALDASEARHEKILEEEGNRDYYDPEQPVAERRKVRKGYRDLQRTVDGTSPPRLLSHPLNPH